MSDSMGMTATAQAASTLKQAQVAQEVQMSVMKKAMDAQETAAAALIDSVAQSTPPAAANPPNLGNNVDVRA